MRDLERVDTRFFHNALTIVVSFLSFAELNLLIAEEAQQNPSQTPEGKSPIVETKTGLPEETLS